MNKFLKEFKDRGFFYQCTNEEELSSLMDKEKIKAYIGFDCTAESLHVGSLLQIMCLRLLQKNGHRPIVLLGGGTTRIGDPSGKDKTRNWKDKKIKARFICALSICYLDKKIASVMGKVEGHISDKPKGKNGFGYDPIFIPNNKRKTFGEMSSIQKYKIDHRFAAFKKIKKFL